MLGQTFLEATHHRQIDRVFLPHRLEAGAEATQR
jgi:hypothetical protein